MVKARHAAPLFGAVTKALEATAAVEEAPPALLATGTATLGALAAGAGVLDVVGALATGTAALAALAAGAGVLDVVGALATGTAALAALGELTTVPVLLPAASAVLESHPHCRARVEHTTNEANIDCL